MTANPGNVCPQNKSLERLQTFFATAHNEWRKYQSTTTGAEFQSANILQEEETTQLYQQETVDAISNLATATASDRAMVATLTATNRTLTLALTACQLKLVEALKNVAKLTTALANLNKIPAQGHPTPEIGTTAGFMAIP